VQVSREEKNGKGRKRDLKYIDSGLLLLVIVRALCLCVVAVLLQCGVVRCGVVRCGAVWCGVVWRVVDIV